jgi:NAD(P)-dependent dehydrogenase (short-subunit alcohol dehydrogenase family)
VTGLPAPQELLDLTGKIVVVTGAAGTIGRGIAGRLSAAGASVVAHTRSRVFTDELHGPTATVRADLRDADGPARVVAAALDAFGRIDGIVNNAGIQPVAAFGEIDDIAWEDMLETNLTAAHRLTRAVAAPMEHQGGGSIVHVASIEGLQPAPGHGHYATAKAALIMHGRSAAAALGPAGIRVNTVSPGLIDDGDLERRWPEGLTRWQAAVPLGRPGSPEDVGDACVFLCSDLSRWITGANLVVDGGVLTKPTW